MPRQAKKEGTPIKSKTESSYEVIPKHEDNRLNYKIILKQLSSSLVGITGRIAPKQILRLFSDERITRFFTWTGLFPTYYYFLVEKAATPLIICEELDLPNQTIYRYLRYLEKHGFIVKAAKVPKASKKGGPKSIIYALPEYKPEDLHDVILRENTRSTPYYKLSRKYAQLLIENCLKPKNSTQISRREIIEFIKDQPEAGFYLSDIVHEVCQLLHYDGVRVWQ